MCVDKNSGQYKAPFNTSTTKPACSPTKTPRSSRRTATRPTRCSGSTCGPSRSCSPCRRSRRAATTRCSSVDGNTFNYGYIGSRATGNEAGDYLVARPRLERRNSRRHQEGLPFQHAVLARDLPHAAVQSGRHAERGESPVRLQGAAALDVSQATGAAGSPGYRFPEGRTARLVKKNFFDYLDFALQFAPAGPEEKEIREKLARIGIGPGKKFDFKDSVTRAQSRGRPGHERRRKKSREGV